MGKFERIDDLQLAAIAGAGKRARKAKKAFHNAAQEAVNNPSASAAGNVASTAVTYAASTAADVLTGGNY